MVNPGPSRGKGRRAEGTVAGGRPIKSTILEGDVMIGHARQPVGREAGKESDEAGALVAISVVIPAFNEEAYLPACLRSLAAQDFELPWEVIVVANDCTDETAAVAAGAGAIVVLEPHRGITWARQKGLEAARGAIVACVDADTCVAPDWLSRIHERLRDDVGVVGLAGRIHYTKGTTWRGRIPSLFVGMVLFSDLAFRFLFRRPGSLWGGNFAVRRSALVEVGGFNREIEFYGEDTELSLRLAKVGAIRYNGRQVAYTSPRRFEHQPLFRTLWPYLTTFARMVALNRTGGLSTRAKRTPAKRTRRRTWTHRFLYTGVALMTALLTTLAFYPTSQAYGKVWYANPAPDRKEVALTFDDGPNEPYTSEVLRILEEHRIRATFFLIGENAAFFPGAVQDIVRHGNVIANHSWHHSFRLPFERESATRSELMRTEDVLFDLTGLRTRLFRPPHGLRTPWFLSDIRDLHYSVVTWNDMTDDYDASESPEAIAKAVIRKASPGGIITLHDGKNLGHGVDRSNTIRALPRIIDALQEQGYTFVTVPELLGIPPYIERGSR